jgi:hypothetical protein
LAREKPLLTLLPLASTPHSGQNAGTSSVTLTGVWVSATPTPFFRDRLPAESHFPRVVGRSPGREKKSF